MAVEIKAIAREKDEDVVRTALHLVDMDPEHRDIYFFDTHDLGLFDNGLVLRARLIKDDTDDSTVKLRPFPEGEERRWKDMKGLEIELDIVGNAAIRSAKLSVDQERGEITKACDGSRPIRTLFSDEQERLIEAYRPKGISWDDLESLGPIKVLKWEVGPHAFPHEVTVEEWVMPNADDLVELSIKVEPNAWMEAGKQFHDLLVEKDIQVAGSQQAKTRSALEYFAQMHPI
jgi:hypothetical protein